MSEIKVDQLSPRTASGTITLGSSGDSLTIPSGGSLTINSGATITNNGTQVGFGGENKTFLATRSGGYFSTGIGDNSWTKSPIGSYNSWGGTIVNDEMGGFDQTNSRWICPSGEGGTYIVGFQFGTHNNGSSVSSEKWRPYINGVAAGYVHHMDLTDFDGGDAGAMQMIDLADGDYVEWWFLANWASSVRLTSCAQWGFKLV